MRTLRIVKDGVVNPRPAPVGAAGVGALPNDLSNEALGREYLVERKTDERGYPPIAMHIDAAVFRKKVTD